MADIDKLASQAWKQFQADGKKWRQSLTDDEGEPHYCLVYSYNKSVTVHGIWDRTTGNYKTVRYHFDDDGTIAKKVSPITGREVK